MRRPRLSKESAEPKTKVSDLRNLPSSVSELSGLKMISGTAGIVSQLNGDN